MSEHLHTFNRQQQSGVDNSDDALEVVGAPQTNTEVAAEAAQARAERAALQAKGALSGDGDAVHELADAGVAGEGRELPHLSKIQESFGKYDVSDVQAHTDGAAKTATDNLGAQAYAKGSHVAFGDSPDLHTAAHEAAHVVQQRAGVQLKGGVGNAGDVYERHADAVADRVVAGQSAEALLSTMAGPEAATGDQALQLMVDDAVQFLGTPLDKPLPEGAATPAHGTTPGKQRRYSVEQYIEMWEKEQGRKMTDREKSTLARGCIGITALNLSGGGNPPLDNAYADFDSAHASMVKMNQGLDALRANPETAAQANGKSAVLFAKLFWSNQDPNPEKRKKPDEDAYKPDDKGRVDMSNYRYRAQPGYVNFDYGFWDEASQCFWHANHSQPGMEVYQSTKEKFSAGYIDFDRIIFCVGIATNYDPGLAAISHG